MMDINRWLRLIAGSFVLASLLLGYYVNPKWFWFTGFVALNLVQSAFTNWCPMMTFLRKLGVRPSLTCPCAWGFFDRAFAINVGQFWDAPLR